MIRRSFLLILLSSPAFALTIVQGPIISNVTHSGFRMFMQTDVASIPIICWSTTSHSGDTDCHNYAQFDGTGYYVVNSMIVSTAPANTTIYARMEVSSGTATVYSSEISTKTLVYPSPHPALPTLPVNFSTAPWVSLFSTTTKTDCSDLTTIVGNSNDYTTIYIATSAIPCRGTYLFPSTTNHLLIRPSSLDSSLPAPGTRIDPSYIPAMASFENNGVNLEITVSTTNANCAFDSWAWNDNLTSQFKLAYCGEAAVGNITAASITQVSGGQQVVATMTVTGSSISLNDQVHVSGVVGIPWANGTMRAIASNAGGTNVTLDHGFLYANGNGTYSSGGTVTKGVWSLATYTPTDGTGTCGNYGDWGFNTANNNLYRCPVAGGPWVRWRIISIGGGFPYYFGWNQTDVTFDLYTNVVKNVTFMGINFSDVQFTTTSLSGRWATNALSDTYPMGSMVNSPHMKLNANSTNIIFDRCIMQSRFPNHMAFAGDISGSMALINDYIKSTSDNGWVNPEDRGVNEDDAAAAYFAFHTGGPYLLYNNYIEAYGISIHFDDQYQSMAPVHDVTVLDNTFYRNPSHFYGNALSDGRYYPLRQLLEFKEGNNININGNIFDGNWRNVSQAAAIFLWAEPYYGETTQVTTDGSGHATVSNGWLTNEISTGDYVTLGYAGSLGFAKVTAVPTPTTLTITPDPGSAFIYSLTGANMQDISITNNIVRNCATGIEVFGNVGSYAYGTNLPVMERGSRIRLDNNLLYNNGVVLSDPNVWQGSGGLLMALDGSSEDTTLTHNTFFGTNMSLSTQVNLFADNSQVNEGANYINNIMSIPYSGQNIAAGGTEGTAAMNIGYSSYTVNNNDYQSPSYSGDPGTYPEPSYFDTSTTTIKFVNPVPDVITGFALQASSPYHNLATDGSDLGVNIPNLITAQGPNFPSSGGGGGLSLTHTFMGSGRWSGSGTMQ